eukprot:258340_1
MVSAVFNTEPDTPPSTDSDTPAKRKREIQVNNAKSRKVTRKSALALPAVPVDECGLPATIANPLRKAEKFMTHGDYAAAIEVLEQCVETATGTKDDAALSTCYCHLGLICEIMGKTSQAFDYYQEHFKVVRTLGQECTDHLAAVYEFL